MIRRRPAVPRQRANPASADEPPAIRPEHGKPARRSRTTYCVCKPLRSARISYLDEVGEAIGQQSTFFADLQNSQEFAGDGKLSQLKRRLEGVPLTTVCRHRADGLPKSTVAVDVCGGAQGRTDLQAGVERLTQRFRKENLPVSPGKSRGPPIADEETRHGPGISRRQLRWNGRTTTQCSIPTSKSPSIALTITNTSACLTTRSD